MDIRTKKTFAGGYRVIYFAFFLLRMFSDLVHLRGRFEIRGVRVRNGFGTNT
jgi:hypothetical protein